MLLYRVTWVRPGWARRPRAFAFHPLHVVVDRQGSGRWDNRHLYAALYLATTPQGAVGETLGNYSAWPVSEISRSVEGHPRCLVTVEVPDDLNLLDFDDPVVLQQQSLRPSDIVRHNREHTQEIANRIWRASPRTGVRGLKWWSAWRPEWENVVLWSPGLADLDFSEVEIVDVEPLDVTHEAVQTAADVLRREILL